MTDARRNGQAVRLALVLAAIVLAAPCFAQAPAGSVLDQPADVAVCLCLEQSSAAEAADMNAKRLDYDHALHDLAELNGQVEQQRTQVDVQNQAQIESFKALLDKHDAAQAQFQSVLLPDYQKSVERYNRTALAISRHCAGHPLDPVAVEQAKRQLACKPD